MNKDKHMQLVRKVTKLLEMEFSIWKFKFGMDPILGLIPGIGDLITFFVSFYIVFVAILHKIPASTVMVMIFYILVDLAIGSIPILGDILDFVIKPNIKNLEMLEKEIAIVSKK